MSSLISNQHAYFNIQRLTGAIDMYADTMREELIEIYLILSGEVIVEGKEHRELLGENNLYCISWKGYNRIDIGENTEGYLIRFNQALIYGGDKEFASLYFPSFQILTLRREVIQADYASLTDSTKMCEMMMQEFEKENNFKQQVLSGFMNIFLFHLMRKLDFLNCNNGDERRFSLIHKFNFLLEQNFKTNKKVSEYASLLSVTPNYLNASIKQATGNSASTHIRRRVVMEAVRKANLTGASMKEVAFDLGFNDNAHFSKFFKKASGTNFSELKKYPLTNAAVFSGTGVT